METENKKTLIMIGVIIGLVSLICTGLLTMASKVDQQVTQPERYKRTPVSYYQWDPSGQGMVVVKITDFQWNDDHTLICVRKDKQPIKQRVCIPPTLALFE